MKTKRKSYLVLFIFVTLISGWLGVLVDAVLTEQPETQSLGMLIWILLPLISAVVFRAKEHEWKSFGLSLHIKSSWPWYLFSLIISPCITVLTILLATTFQCAKSGFWDKNFLTVIFAATAGSVIKNIFEEFSWRGYLVPRLLEEKISDWFVYGISGLVWGLWHAPYYMVFLSDAFFEDSSRIATLVAGILLMLVWSILFVELYRITDSVWPCVILHSVLNGIQTLPTFSDVSATEFVFNPTSGLISVVVLFTSGLLLRYIRRRKQNENGMNRVM